MTSLVNRYCKRIKLLYNTLSLDPLLLGSLQFQRVFHGCITKFNGLRFTKRGPSQPAGWVVAVDDRLPLALFWRKFESWRRRSGKNQHLHAAAVFCRPSIDRQ